MIMDFKHLSLTQVKWEFIEIEHPGTFKVQLKADFINPKDPVGLVLYEIRMQKI